jgi:hypothetical protein
VEDYKFIDSNLGADGLLVGSKCNHYWVMSGVAAPAYATPLALLAPGTGHGKSCVAVAGAQGGVLYPLLSNIYLHEFDLFMNEYLNKHSSKENNISKVNPKIVAYSTKLSTLQKIYIENRDPLVWKEIRSVRKEINSQPSIIRTGNRISYVRYADDWLIGIIGNKVFAEQVKEDVKLFLENTLKLDLSVEKTKITSLTKDKARFLGVDIHIPKAKERKMVYRTLNGRSITSRINQVRVNFLMPYKEIIENLAKEGLVKKFQTGGKIITNAITK